MSKHPPPPDEAALHAAALAYLARYAASRAMLTRALQRRVDRWARATTGEDVAALAAAARSSVADVVGKLAASGAVNDDSFAALRVRRLTRAGRSRTAAAADLAARGVVGASARDALAEDPERELAAAAAFLRRRRFGPFRDGAADAERTRRELAALARAGFGRATATRALSLTAEVAAALLARLREG